MVKGNWTCYEPKSSSEKNLTDEVNKNFKTNRRNSSSQRNNSDKDSKRDDYYICKIFSGGDHNFALAEHSQVGSLVPGC